MLFCQITVEHLTAYSTFNLDLTLYLDLRFTLTIIVYFSHQRSWIDTGCDFSCCLYQLMILTSCVRIAFLNAMRHYAAKLAKSILAHWDEREQSSFLSYWRPSYWSLEDILIFYKMSKNHLKDDLHQSWFMTYTIHDVYLVFSIFWRIILKSLLDIVTINLKVTFLCIVLHRKVTSQFIVTISSSDFKIVHQKIWGP